MAGPYESRTDAASGGVDQRLQQLRVGYKVRGEAEQIYALARKNSVPRSPRSSNSARIDLFFSYVRWRTESEQTTRNNPAVFASCYILSSLKSIGGSGPRYMLMTEGLFLCRHEAIAGTTVEHQCTASIGIALFRKHETSQDDILRWANTTMYQAKEAGCNLIRVYASTA